MALIRSTDPLVWIDCEMTGLDPQTESILSLACFITDSQLNLLDEDGYEAVIHQPKSRLDRMDAWCTSTHAASGLTQSCINSTTTADDASDALLRYVKRYCPEKRTALLAGNSVHADRSFLMKQPWNKVLEHLHYRLLDVSAIKEGLRRWAGEQVLHGAPAKKGLHTARSDILESIEEARWVKGLFMKLGEGCGKNSGGEGDGG